jgi:hypothetical protein
MSLNGCRRNDVIEKCLNLEGNIGAIGRFGQIETLSNVEGAQLHFTLICIKRRDIWVETYDNSDRLCLYRCSGICIRSMSL